MKRASKMTTIDAFEDHWTVIEERATRHGFSVLLGYPASRNGSGGKRTIITVELKEYLESRRFPVRGVDLPLGRNTITKIRKLLAIDWRTDHANWWEERLEDLASLTLNEFADRHSVSLYTALDARHALLGPVLRPAGWWRDESVQEVLRTLPVSEAAASLGVSAGTVWRLRSISRLCG